MEGSFAWDALVDALTPVPTEESLLPRNQLLRYCEHKDFRVGTGLSNTEYISSQIQQAEYEVLFVTCFWARSSSLEVFNQALVALNSRALEANKRIRVRVAFSSVSIQQKLLHTSSTNGKIWPQSSWTQRLGLPDHSELTNLDLEVKSLFFRPVSVLHSKFVIIDRKVVILPSSNISWECWLECCLTLTGPIVTSFVGFWRAVWASAEEKNELFTDVIPEDNRHGDQTKTTTVLLPHPWHQNPAIPFLRWLSRLLPGLAYAPGPPPSPQNLFILQAISMAKDSIYIQTPNFTCNVLVNAVYDALNRGVNIELVTCKNMMVIEQIATACQTTEWCISRLQGRLRNAAKRQTDTESAGCLGALIIRAYKPSMPRPKTTKEEADYNFAQQSHAKVIIVDGHTSILGSANCDRASWYTSLELNVAIHDATFANGLRNKLAIALEGKTEDYNKSR